MRYSTILADCPWPQKLSGKYKTTRNQRPSSLPYPTMTVDEIRALPVAEWADENAHLWLWTTNSFLRQGFDVLEKWGFKYLCPITWVKPSGLGNWFVSRTQTCLFGYRGKLHMQKRYLPNVLFAPAVRHSKKPTQAYELIEQVSSGPYLELFARQTRPGWTSIGNQIDGKDIRDITLNTP